ncbi:Flap-structured DNA-binding and RNA-binding protein [Coemansia sp. RSA 552]|nr:Flap-structured DNA-binding and RNA-binding protein [Coemansia sp. RSA 552]
MSSNAPTPTVVTASADPPATLPQQQAAPPPQQVFIPTPPVAPFAGGGGGKGVRPASEIFFANAQHPLPGAKHVDQWFESLSQFEDMLEDMAKVSLDSEFKNELDTIDDWFSVLAEPERTAALYSLMQHCSDLQVRFFITILQQMLMMDQVTEANGAAVGAPPGIDGATPDRHSVAAQVAYSKPQGLAGTPGRMSYDSGPAGASPAFGPMRGAAGPGLPMLAGSPSVQRAGGWNNGSNLSTDSLLLMGAGNGAKLVSSHDAETRRSSGLVGDAAQLQQRPKSSNHEADVNPDWRVNRVSQNGPAASPTSEHFGGPAAAAAAAAAAAQLGIGSVAASRRQSNNLFAAQSTPRASVDMEPKDFRWSSLTESLEPFGNNIGPDPSASALTHMLDANKNRTSGIAARRSVSSRLSIPVKSPRDTMQAQQLGSSLAQMSLSGSGQHLSSPLASTFAQQQQQQQQAQQASRGGYAQPAAPSSYNQQQQQLYAGSRGAAPTLGSSGSSMATTPVRAAFGRPGSSGTSAPPAVTQPPPTVPGAQPVAAGQAPTSSSSSTGAPKSQPDMVDMKLVQDIPSWLRSLRLHKYTDCFTGMDWTSVVSLSDEQLQAKGVAALGARRKMLKVFESVLLEADKPT